MMSELNKLMDIWNILAIHQNLNSFVNTIKIKDSIMTFTQAFVLGWSIAVAIIAAAITILIALLIAYIVYRAVKFIIIVILTIIFLILERIQYVRKNHHA